MASYCIAFDIGQWEGRSTLTISTIHSYSTPPLLCSLISVSAQLVGSNNVIIRLRLSSYNAGCCVSANVIILCCWIFCIAQRYHRIVLDCLSVSTNGIILQGLIDCIGKRYRLIVLDCFLSTNVIVLQYWIVCIDQRFHIMRLYVIFILTWMLVQFGIAEVDVILVL